jgi:hypothetical protein
LIHGFETDLNDLVSTISVERPVFVNIQTILIQLDIQRSDAEMIEQLRHMVNEMPTSQKALPETVAEAVKGVSIQTQSITDILHRPQEKWTRLSITKVEAAQDSAKQAEVAPCPQGAEKASDEAALQHVHMKLA